MEKDTMKRIACASALVAALAGSVGIAYNSGYSSGQKDKAVQWSQRVERVEEGLRRKYNLSIEDTDKLLARTWPEEARKELQRYRRDYVIKQKCVDDMAREFSLFYDGE